MSSTQTSSEERGTGPIRSTWYVSEGSEETGIWCLRKFCGCVDDVDVVGVAWF